MGESGDTCEEGTGGESKVMRYVTHNTRHEVCARQWNASWSHDDPMLGMSVGLTVTGLNRGTKEEGGGGGEGGGVGSKHMEVAQPVNGSEPLMCCGTPMLTLNNMP